jgi:hypothetical protein
MLRILGVLALIAGQANGQTFVSGNMLLEDCEGGEFPKVYCLGYVVGALDMATQQGNGIKGWTFCTPEGVTQAQVMGITILWLKRNPKDRHVAAANSILRAMNEAYPCD